MQTSALNTHAFVVRPNPLLPPLILRDATTGNYTGAFIELARILAERLNFVPEFVTPPDGKWGVAKNGTWTGQGRTDTKLISVYTMSINNYSFSGRSFAQGLNRFGGEENLVASYYNPL